MAAHPQKRTGSVAVSVHRRSSAGSTYLETLRSQSKDSEVLAAADKAEKALSEVGKRAAK